MLEYLQGLDDGSGPDPPSSTSSTGGRSTTASGGSSGAIGRSSVAPGGLTALPEPTWAMLLGRGLPNFALEGFCRSSSSTASGRSVASAPVSQPRRRWPAWSCSSRCAEASTLPRWGDVRVHCHPGASCAGGGQRRCLSGPAGGAQRLLGDRLSPFGRHPAAADRRVRAPLLPLPARVPREQESTCANSVCSPLSGASTAWPGQGFAWACFWRAESAVSFSSRS